MTSASIPIAVARERLLPVLGAMAALTWVGDFLFWGHSPGISVALFACVCAALLYGTPGSERPSRAAGMAMALLLASCCATILEISFSNVAVLVALLAAIMGERHFREIPGRWARWTESLAACLGGFRRWPWLMRTLRESELAEIGLNSVTQDRAVRALQIVTPAVSLTIVFVVVLSFGNAVFGSMLSHLSTDVVVWLVSFDFSFLRLILWGVLGTLALVLVRPHSAPEQSRPWVRSVPQFLRPDLTVAIWQSCLVFVALNLIFFTVNTIDVIYLWRQKGLEVLPVDVTFSQFVHQGVNGLIMAVLLSAVVIAVIFQQDEKVTRCGALKVLAWIWIAQNLVLISGVFLRLKLYVDAYQLSEQRVYVGCFLLLVTLGFGLLAWHVARSGNLAALLWRNVLATFGLFFVIQFLDVTGWVARFNVAQWRREPARTLDLSYLASMGPGAWPALCDVALSKGSTSTIRDARTWVEQMANRETDERANRNWRSYQARRSAQSRRLMATAPNRSISL